MTTKSPIKVAVTGAAGNIGYSLLFPLAAGQVFGPDQPIELQLLEIPQGLQSLEGVKMELLDSAFSLVTNITCTSDGDEGFGDVDYAFLVGSKPRGPGMERADLIRENGPIFVGQGQAIDRSAKENVKVIVVGNPCNTNCLIAQHQAKRVNPRNFTAMTRLDQNRAKAQLALKAGVQVSEVSRLAIWGNHSPTMYPDFENALIGGRALTEVISDHDWLKADFIKTVQQRGKAIINARGKSSAASAAWAAIDHAISWSRPTAAGEWVSMAVPSDGSYGIAEGLIYSFPCTVNAEGDYSIVPDVALSPFAKEKAMNSANELLAERDAVKDILG
ncbi:MAG: malate dehydrogenase [Myxococcales bacterium]|nr:malate dehydrogenase [Myxococcales bacterium]